MDAVLEAVPRTSRGKNEARRLRVSGKIPAVIYGGEKPGGEAIAVDSKVLWKILHSGTGENTLISLRTPDGGDVRVLVRQFQIDPVTSGLLHADFYRVAMDRKLQVTVPVVLRGEAPGVKQQGGILEFVHREIEIECLPGDIPERLDVDVSNLMVGQAIRLRDVLRDARWSVVSELDTMLVHVIMPKVEEAPAAPEVAATAAAPAEPEVIKKGKVEKAEEDAEKE